MILFKKVCNLKLTFLFLALATYAYSAIWDGTVDTTWYTDNKNSIPFTISTAEQLAGLAKLVNGSAENGTYDMKGKIIFIANDIELNDTTDWQSWDSTTTDLNQWEAIGTSENLFKGYFIGGENIISGMYINTKEFFQGLFGCDSAVYIENIGVINFYVKGGNYVGGLTGSNLGTISKSYARGMISGDSIIGGLIGLNAGTVSTSYANVNVIGTGNYVGGFVGFNTGEVSNSYVNGTVSGRRNVGGFIGYNVVSAISNSYASGTVKGYNCIGGFIGYNVMSPISNSYAIGMVSGSGDSLGGFIGANFLSNISKSYYDSTISKQSDIGKGVPKTTEEMKTKSTFVDWNFATVWDINSNFNDGYPILIRQNPNNLVYTVIGAIVDREYNGSAFTPEPVVKMGEITLVKDVDYELSYSNNINAGTATVTITGIGGTYSGSKATNFTITRVKLTVTGVTAGDKEYDGTTMATLSGATLSGVIAGDDVSIGESKGTFARIEAGENISVEAYFELTGANTANYTLIQPRGLTASIFAKELTSDFLSSSIEDLTYTGFAITQEGEVSVTDGKKKLIKNFDYTISYSKNVNVGIAEMIIIGKGNYGGEVKIEFIINPRTISHLDFPSISDQVYTGEMLNPEVELKYRTITLVKDVDYELSYSDNVDVGTATMTITGIGNYSGSKSVTFEIINAPLPILSHIPRQTTQSSMVALNNAFSVWLVNSAALNIYNLKGEKVRSLKLSSGVYEVSLFGLPKGIYLVKAKFGVLRVSVR